MTYQLPYFLNLMPSPDKMATPIKHWVDKAKFVINAVGV